MLFLLYCIGNQESWQGLAPASHTLLLTLPSLDVHHMIVTFYKCFTPVAECNLENPSSIIGWCSFLLIQIRTQIHMFPSRALGVTYADWPPSIIIVLNTLVPEKQTKSHRRPAMWKSHFDINMLNAHWFGMLSMSPLLQNLHQVMDERHLHHVLLQHGYRLACLAFDNCLACSRLCLTKLSRSLCLHISRWSYVSEIRFTGACAWVCNSNALLNDQQRPTWNPL